jgi:demethylmenaquinone methyltransferase/2-methoxy-6-polyprenyl-1,4-benzoquinol methylase
VIPEAERARAVSMMFTRIADRYDVMNSLMTAGRHHAWRRATARAAAAAPAGPVLDLATGTGDLAIALRGIDPTRVVVGADFSLGMLRHARRKLDALRGAGAGPPPAMAREPGGGQAPALRGQVGLAAADALRLPFAAGAFACVVSAFLLRNLVDLERGLSEMRRVTRPGGRVVALEITRVAVPLWGRIFGVYFRRLVPAMGALVAGDRQAYTYLPASVDRFLTARELANAMERAGLREVHFRTFGLGTVALHVGVV